MAGAESRTACGADSPGELARVVEKIERPEIVPPTCIVLPAFTYAEEHTAIVAGRGLARLHIEVIGVHRDFSADGRAAFVISQIK